MQIDYSTKEVTSELTSMRAELGPEKSALLASRGRGATIKIHMAAEVHGNPVNLGITGREVHDEKATHQTCGSDPGQSEKIQQSQSEPGIRCTFIQRAAFGSDQCCQTDAFPQHCDPP